MPAESQQQRPPEQTEVQVPASLLDQIVEGGRLGQSPEERQQGRDWIQAFLGEIMKSEVLVSEDTQAMISARIAQLDALLSGELNQILHAPEFQKLEATWRGRSEEHTSELQSR